VEYMLDRYGGRWDENGRVGLLVCGYGGGGGGLETPGQVAFHERQHCHGVVHYFTIAALFGVATQIGTTDTLHCVATGCFPFAAGSNICSGIL